MQFKYNSFLSRAQRNSLNQIYSGIPLTIKQAKARAKNKRAKQARKINR